MGRKRKPGRPPTFNRADRKTFADLIRQHGARKAREVCPKKVSVGTLLKIAHEFGIPLMKGRRPRKAA